MDMYPTFAKLARPSLSDFGRKFLERRGIPTDLATKFGLGSVGGVVLKSPLISDTERDAVYTFENFVNEARGSLVVPLHTLSGDPVSAQLRSLTNTRDFRFVMTPYGRFYGPLWGIHAQKDLLVRSKAVILTESALDSLSVLLAEPRCPVVSGLTSGISRRQAEWLSRFVERVVIMFDNDRAGREGAYQVQKRLEKVGIKTHKAQYSGDDPNDLLLTHGLGAMKRVVRSISMFARF